MVPVHSNKIITRSYMIHSNKIITWNSWYTLIITRNYMVHSINYYELDGTLSKYLLGTTW